jgi:HK97 family phage major capsid protein
MPVNVITAKTIDEKYDEAARILKRANEVMAGEMTDKEREQVDAWLAQVDDIKREAKQIEKLISAEQEMAEQESKANLAREQKENDQKAQQAGFAAGWEYMKAIFDWRVNAVHDRRLEKLLNTKDMSGETGISGGFLIPTDQRNEVLQTRGEASFMRSRARLVPMGSRSVDFPAVDYSRGASGKSAMFAGVQVYYTEENTDITESQPYFKSVDLKARELAGYVEIPNGLLRDSAISLEAFLSGPGSFGGAIAWQEDYDALRGNGAGKPLGVLNADATISVSRNTASTFKFVDAVTMASKMIMSGNPVWIMNQSVMPQLYQMIDGASNNIWQPNAANGRPGTLLGYPILFTEKLPALGTAGDVVLVDWAWYLWGDRQTIMMDVSRESKFQSNQTAFRVVEAIDGQPWINDSITLADGSTSVSPFVKLS